MTAALLLATIVPLAALTGAAALDRQHGRSLLFPIAALAWGLACPWLVAPLNQRWVVTAGLTSLTVVGAPIIEESIKAAALPLLTASRRCSWFVDGALFGLASGTGFAIRENWLYLRRGSSDGEVALALARVTSTNLMHAGCTAIVGAALATALGRTLPARRAAVVRLAAGGAGLGTAIVLHAVFNRGSTAHGSALWLTLLGVAVFAAAVGLVALGLPLSRHWAITDMAARGLSAGEQAALGGRGAAGAGLLDEFEARFGTEAATAAERLIALQRRIGVLARLDGGAPGGAGATDGRPDNAELQRLQDEADALRRRIGLFAMGWLRSHLPVDRAAGMWASLAGSIDEPDAGPPQPGSTPPPVPGGLWATLADETGENRPPT